MAAKRRKHSGVPSGQGPFSQLANLVRQAGIRLESEEEVISKALPLPKTQPEPEDPAQVFEQAMEGISRAHWRHEPAPAPPVLRPASREDPEAADERLFQEAMRGEATPPILEHPEYIEGWIGLAGQRFICNLRNGVYSIQGALDLHGLGRLEAREAVEEFIVRMSRGRSCCVKIVHGRGINSPADKAILKEHLQRWLATRRMSLHVVAYASAPYTDGGVGAIYVLLRRSQR